MIVFTDIDGVWTDGGMIYHDNGTEGKMFNVKDGGGVALLKSVGFKTGVITGESTEVVDRRVKKLKFDYYFKACKAKLNSIKELCKTEGFELENIAYIGDDINDIELLSNVGFSACPSDAPAYIKNIVSHVCSKRGGDGVFREFVEIILEKENLLEIALKNYLKSQDQ
ncbi:MAG: KdsC family phosphatase [Bacteroidales bacterium]